MSLQASYDPCWPHSVDLSFPCSTWPMAPTSLPPASLVWLMWLVQATLLTATPWFHQAKSLSPAASAMCPHGPSLSVQSSVTSFLIWCDLYSMTITFLALMSLLPPAVDQAPPVGHAANPLSSPRTDQPRFPRYVPSCPFLTSFSSHLGTFLCTVLAQCHEWHSCHRAAHGCGWAGVGLSHCGLVHVTWTCISCL